MFPHFPNGKCKLESGIFLIKVFFNKRLLHFEAAFLVINYTYSNVSFYKLNLPIKGWRIILNQFMIILDKRLNFNHCPFTHFSGYWRQLIL